MPNSPARPAPYLMISLPGGPSPALLPPQITVLVEVGTHLCCKGVFDQNHFRWDLFQLFSFPH